MSKRKVSTLRPKMINIGHVHQSPTGMYLWLNCVLGFVLAIDQLSILSHLENKNAFSHLALLLISTSYVCPDFLSLRSISQPLLGHQPALPMPTPGETAQPSLPRAWKCQKQRQGEQHSQHQHAASQTVTSL